MLYRSSVAFDPIPALKIPVTYKDIGSVSFDDRSHPTSVVCTYGQYSAENWTVTYTRTRGFGIIELCMDSVSYSKTIHVDTKRGVEQWYQYIIPTDDPSCRNERCNEGPCYIYFDVDIKAQLQKQRKGEIWEKYKKILQKNTARLEGLKIPGVQGLSQGAGATAITNV